MERSKYYPYDLTDKELETEFLSWDIWVPELLDELIRRADARFPEKDFAERWRKAAPDYESDEVQEDQLDITYEAAEAIGIRVE